jgi:mono/diheme cytochrome c family protein
MTRVFWLGAMLVATCLPLSAQDVASIYGANCAHCHGADGRGNTPLGRALKLRDLRSYETKGRTEEDLIVVIGKGAAQGKMPAFQKKLGPEAVRLLAVYVHDIDHQVQPPATTTTGNSSQPMDVKEVYLSRCAHCHASDASGNSVLGRQMKIHDLRTGLAQITDEQLITIIAHGSDGGRMPGFQKKLGQEMVSELGRYLRELTGTGNARPLRTEAPLPSPAMQDPGTDAAVAADKAAPSANVEQLAHAVRTAPAIPQSGGTTHPQQAMLQAPTTKIIDLNSAGKEALMTLPGITEQDAENIISGRPYKSTLQFKVRHILTPESYERIAGMVYARAPQKKSKKD